MTLTVLSRAGQVFCRMFLNLVLSDDFLMTKLGLCIWGKNTTEVRCPSRHVTSGGTWYPQTLSLVMLTLTAWLRWSLPGLSPVKFSIFPFPYSRGKSLSPDSTQRWWELNSTSWGRVEYLLILFGILPYLLFISYEYGLYTLACNPIWLFFTVNINSCIVFFLMQKTYKQWCCVKNKFYDWWDFFPPKHFMADFE